MTFLGYLWIKTITGEQGKMKRCIKCQVETERNKGGKCKICVKAYKASYYIDNREKVDAKAAEYRAANPGKVETNAAARYAD